MHDGGRERSSWEGVGVGEVFQLRASGLRSVTQGCRDRVLPRDFRLRPSACHPLSWTLQVPVGYAPTNRR